MMSPVMIDALLSLLIPIAYAQLPAGISDAGCNFALGGPTDGAGNPIPGGMWACIPVYLRNITFVVITIAASISLLMIIVNGFRYMVMPAIGDSSDAAKKGIIYAIVGLGVSLLSYVILDTIIVSVTS